MNQASPKWSFRIGRIFLQASATFFVLFLLLVVSINVGLEVVLGIYEAAFHLALGFVFLLIGKESAFPADGSGWPDLLVLSLLAFGLAPVIGKRLASRGSGACTSRHLQALALVVLALLVASLVIGGIWRNLKVLAKDRVFVDRNGIDGYDNLLVAAELQKALQEVSKSRKQFPDSLGDLQVELSEDWIAAVYRDP